VLRRRSLKPLLETVSDRYHPTVEEFLDHVERTRERSGWDESFVPRRVGRVQAHDDGFEIDGDRFRHVLLAPGHPGLNVPDELRRDVRAVHAYEPHEYASTVTVVGAGLAAATEWLNALAAGAEVVSVRRHEPARRPLNVPREYFSRRGLGAFHRLPRHERIERLHALSAPSYPAGREWDEPLEQAGLEGRFRVEASLNGSAQVICADRVPARLAQRSVAGATCRRSRSRNGRRLGRARPRLHRAHPERPGEDAGARRSARPVGVPRGRHTGRRAIRRSPFPEEDQGVSYTLKGRIESRLAALLPVLLGCCVLAIALRHWWPVELCALMAAVGLVLDVQVWHRLFRYQSAWVILPLGLVELGLVLAIVYGAGLHAPLGPALLSSPWAGSSRSSSRRPATRCCG
jgi:hypothetical protein